MSDEWTPLSGYWLWAIGYGRGGDKAMGYGREIPE